MTAETWAVGAAYEAYVGRWSRLVAGAFVRSLDLAPGGRWVDVGCGTGALTETVLALAGPAEVVGVDASQAFVAYDRDRIAGARFLTGDATALPLPDASADAVVSGLVLNFVPSPDLAVAEAVRVAVPGGVVAAYVWDYAEGMELMRHFWDAATALDPGAAELDEGRRFPLCRPEPLRALWTGAGLREVRVEPIEITTAFAGFDDFWTPFLGGQGPAPGYVMALPEERRSALREELRRRLPADLALHARAWSVRGHTPKA